MWKALKLGEVVTYEKNNGQGCNKPYVGMENISTETMELVGDISIPEKTSTTFVFNDSHVLFGRLRPYLRKVLVPDFDGQCSTEIFCLKPDKQLNRKYLAYWLLSDKISQLIVGTSTGARMPRANMNAILDFEITIPPLAQQQRIVAKLDAAFEKIDKAISHTDECTLSSKALFLEMLCESVNDKRLGKEILLGEVCTLSQGLAINKSTKHLLVPFSSQPLLRIKDLVSDTVAQYVDDDYKNAKTTIGEDDLIFTRTGSLGLVFRGRKGVLHNNSFKVETDKRLSLNYFYWWLKNPKFLTIIHSIAGKAAQPDISHKLFKAQYIILPTLKRQGEIAAAIEECMSHCESLTNIYKMKKENLVNLKSSILAQELNGEAA